MRNEDDDRAEAIGCAALLVLAIAVPIAMCVTSYLLGMAAQ